MTRDEKAVQEFRAAEEYFSVANLTACAQLRSTMDRSYSEVNCGHRVPRKPTLDEQEGSWGD
jgi:hypothetical protein